MMANRGGWGKKKKRSEWWEEEGHWRGSKKEGGQGQGKIQGAEFMAGRITTNCGRPSITVYASLSAKTKRIERISGLKE